MKKDNTWLLLLIVMAIITASVTSCSQEEDTKLNGKRKARVHKATYQPEVGFVIHDNITLIEYVDTIYKPGEIFWGNSSYVTLAHSCSDYSHVKCDGDCVCDGFECRPNYSVDYTLSFIEDSIRVYDGARYVGTIPMFDNSPLDRLLLQDNE